MQLLIVFVVAVGVCAASPAGFLRNTPEVQAATHQFIMEYNRLARLAAMAPDIHIFHQDPRQLQRVDAHVHRQRAPVPVAAPIHRHAASNLNSYSYSANLGSNQQFLPNQFQSPFIQQVAQSVHRPHHTQIAAPTQQRKYTGPFADTVPAGVHGLPAQVTHTPEVQAARNAHFRVLSQAYQSAGHLG